MHRSRPAPSRRRPLSRRRNPWSVLSSLIAFALLASVAASATAAAQTDYDVVITGGRIIDGTGAAWFYGDVGIRGDTIATIAPRGALADAAAATRIDAEGLVVSPGFIDIQSQSRWAFLFGDGRSIGKLTQGITTEIMGEGTSNAPLNARNRTLLGGLPEDPEVAASFESPHGFDAWLRAMQEHGVSPNFGSFVGASTIRTYGKGMSMGAASADELEAMRGAVRRSMEDGAFGIASALIYVGHRQRQGMPQQRPQVDEARPSSMTGPAYRPGLSTSIDARKCSSPRRCERRGNLIYRYRRYRLNVRVS